MNSHYMTGQLIPIDLPEICAPRLSLMDTYRNAASKRCVYISAPAGSGKTVSTLLWLKKSGHKVIWISLDRYDDGPAAFYRVLLTAIATVIPQEEALFNLINSPAFNASPVEFTVEALVRFSFNDGPHALVFDDFHLIANEEILKSFYYVMKRFPVSFLMMIISRIEPPDAFLPFMKNGQISIIRGEDLAFNHEEIRRHFASFGRFLTEREAEKAYIDTEGWAIAVNALAISGSAYTGEDSTRNPLRKFIQVQIWDKLGEDLRSFMMQTAIVDKFSEELCQSITLNTESRQILNSMLMENLFLSHQDGEYRYHHLFLDFLREELSVNAEWDLSELHQRAAEYYWDSDDDRNSLYHFIQCNNSQGISKALGRFLVLNVESSSDMWSISYICKLPPKITEQNPCLHVGCAWCKFFFGEPEDTFFHLDIVYKRISDILFANKDFLQPVLLLYINDPRYSITQQLDRMRLLNIPFVEERERVLKILSHKLPYFLRIYRDFTKYALNMEESFAQFRTVFSPIFKTHYTILESGMRSSLLYNQNRIREALSFVTTDPVPSTFELTFLSRLQIAICLYSAGREEEAARYRRELISHVQSENMLHLMPILIAYDTKLKLLDGSYDAAKEWFTYYFVDSQIQFFKLFMHATTVRAHIVLGEYEKAETTCYKLHRLCAGYQRVLDVAEANVLLAILLWLTKRREEALALLEKTIWEMQPYGYIRVFADEGKALLPLLKQLTKSFDRDSSMDASKHEFLREVYLATYDQSKRHKGIASTVEQKPVRLSRQQKYVLELLAKGYKNAEIVDMTGLSINTIRYHTKIVYEKLDVTNAMDAVLKGRELRLIE